MIVSHPLSKKMKVDMFPKWNVTFALNRQFILEQIFHHDYVTPLV